MDHEENRLPIAKAVFIIFFFTLIVSGSGTLGWLYYRHLREARLHDDRFNIIAIIESHKEETLPNGYLAEILQLSKDKPVNLHAFSLEAAQKNLLAHPLIRKGEVKKVNPNMIWVDYQLRKPIALIADFTNTAVDSEGMLFPFAPFYDKQELPRIYLGLEQSQQVWGSKIESPAFRLACETLKSIKQNEIGGKLEIIDVADAFAESCGKRQMIVELKESDQTILLRLSPDHFHLRTSDFLSLKKEFESDLKKQKVLIIDFRIPKLAFIKTEE